MNEVVELVEEARRVRENAYAPYSNFKVGAALRTITGEIFTGCNVENSSFGGTICAERVAVVKAVSEGFKEFKAIAIVSANNKPLPPCGICRQFLAEFNPNIEIILADLEKILDVRSLEELLPMAFTKDYFKK